MNELKDLADLVSQYDWREAINVGIAAEMVHAVYDKTKGNRRESDSLFGSGGGVFFAAYNIDGIVRSLGNAIAGGFAYHLVYTGTYKLLDRMSITTHFSRW